MAHSTSIWKVVSAPLSFDTMPSQNVPSGNEALTFASVLSEDTTTPPPSGTVPAGHWAEACVCWPWGAVIWLVSRIR